MGKAKLFTSNQVHLPGGLYKLTAEEQESIKDMAEDGDVQLQGGVYVASVYCYKRKYFPTGCLSFIGFKFSKRGGCYPHNKVNGDMAIKRISINKKTMKNNGGCPVVSYKPIENKNEVPDKRLRQSVLELYGLSEEKLTKDFEDPQSASSILSFLILDRVCPGTDHKSNMIRLEFLAEASENKRLKILMRLAEVTNYRAAGNVKARNKKQ